MHFEEDFIVLELLRTEYERIDFCCENLNTDELPNLEERCEIDYVDGNTSHMLEKYVYSAKIARDFQATKLTKKITCEEKFAFDLTYFN